ncbi:hypothetical protein [Sporosarcina cyprini]|uniref:hypothetical protein n=1 Tax=Sporosarcina cyprini TaxID=2910523 RepID=UPI001EDDE4BF|nr:hypothetical protein [Sporosarcina cyprini]MCG3088279.1 hypothetical protein [Sporosarcina cyprini]
MKKTNETLKRVLLLSAVLLVTVALGSGMNKVWANQDIQSLLTNWFHGKKTESIQQLEQAITSEKELLMEELRAALQEEMKKAEEELARYTEEETAKRVQELQDYAAGLMANIQIDTTTKKAEISADLDAALVQAMGQLNGSGGVCTPKTTPPTPAPIPGEGQGNPADTDEETAEPETEGTETDSSEEAKYEAQQRENESTEETEAPSVRPEEEAEILPSIEEKEEKDSTIEVDIKDELKLD